MQNETQETYKLRKIKNSSYLFLWINVMKMGHVLNSYLFETNMWIELIPYKSLKMHLHRVINYYLTIRMHLLNIKNMFWIDEKYFFIISIHAALLVSYKLSNVIYLFVYVVNIYSSI